MNQQGIRFISLLAVIGVSVFFGVVIGGRINTPQIALATPGEPIRLAPATTGIGGNDFADIVEQAMPAVVSVTSAQLGGDDDEDRSGRGNPMSPDDLWERFFGPGQPPQRPNGPETPRIGEGSGFIISEDGYILTNYHVVQNADDLEVGFSDGTDADAVLVGTDPSIDLALLKIETGRRLPTLPLGDSKALRVGQWVIAIGNPLEYEQTVTVGVISAKERRVPIGTTDSGVVSFLQTDAAINFGNSGGPLLDAAGNVVGINTAIRRQGYAEGIGFALPINQARRVIEQLRETGKVRRGFIGISMNPNGIDEAAAEWFGLPDRNGVLVDEVTPGGPADRAGLREGDIIRQVDGDRVKDNLDLISKIATQLPGDEVVLEVFRDGKTRTLTATLQDRDDGLAAQRGRNAPGAERPREDAPKESVGLGFTVQNLTSRLRENLEIDADVRGVIVVEVEFDSEAMDKGINRNWVITEVNDRTVRDVSDWDAALADLSPGQPVKLTAIPPGGRAMPLFLRVPRD